MNTCYQKSTTSAYNNISQSVGANETVIIPAGTSTGKSTRLTNNAIEICTGGLYKISANMNGVNGTGTVVLQLRNNGVNVNGASASATLTAADVTALGFTYILNIANCPCGINTPATLTIANTGVASTISNVNITVEKIA